MPETIATYIATATLTAESVLTFNAILAATYAATAVAYVGYGTHQRRKAESRARAAYNSSLQDRNVTLRGTLQSRQLVLGKVRTGGVLVFAGSTGSDKEKLTLVLALASHRIAGVDSVFFNDEEVTLDGSGYVTSGTYSKTESLSASEPVSIVGGAASFALFGPPLGPVRLVYSPGGDTDDTRAVASVSGTTASITGFGGTFTGTAYAHYQYASTTPRARVRWMLGTDDQAAFADLVTQFPAEWTADHRLRGIAYLVAELDYDPDVFPAGIPNISAVVRGADEVLDPRTNTTGYTENPALLLRHYLLHPFGGRRTAAQLDEASLIVAANVCDTSVDYGSGAAALYTAGTVASTEQTPASVCDELTEAMAGRWGYSGGVIRVRAGAVGAAVAAIDADWLAEGGLTVQPRRPRAELGNVMQGSFVDPASNWQLVPFPRVPEGAELAAMVAEDGGQELPQELEFAAITRVGQAQQVAATLLREARQALTVTLDCNMRAYSLQMFDTVTLTLERYGWDAKLFEVAQRSFTLGGAIRLTLRETGSSIYAFGTSFGTTDALPNTSLPNPWVVPTVGTITATSGAGVLSDGSIVARVVLTWPAVADRNVTQGGYIELAYREAGDPAAEFQTVRADSYTGHTVVGLRGGRAYVFQARAVNGLGVRGRYSLQTMHTVWRARAPYIYRQTSAPSGDVRDGDEWIDTDDGEHRYLRASGAWVSVRDATIATAQGDATAAAAAAAAAQGDASTAIVALADIASDSVLTPGEKPRVIQDRDVIVAEQAGIDAQATNYGVTTEKTAYDAAVAALVAYLATLTSAVAWDNLSGNTTIVGATFRSKFADVYTTRQALLDAISAAAKARLGALATLSTVGTGQIDANAATEVTESSASAVAVTGTAGTGPQGYGTAKWSSVLTIAFTAGLTGNVALHIAASVSFAGAATVTYGGTDFQDNELWINADFDGDGQPSTGEQLLHDYGAAAQPGTGICRTVSISAVLPVAVTSGVSYSWPIYAKRNNGTVTLDSIYVRVEQIKR